MGNKKVTVRQVIASKRTNNWHSFAEFKIEEGFSTEAEASLLIVAGQWLAKHSNLTLLATQFERRSDYTLFLLFLEQ